MSKGINITVSGGNASFGNIIQGDYALPSSGEQSISGIDDRAFSEFFSALSVFQQQQPSRRGEIDDLKRDVEELKEIMERDGPTFLSRAADHAKFLYEKYGWAGDMLKILFDVVVQK